MMSPSEWPTCQDGVWMLSTLLDRDLPWPPDASRQLESIDKAQVYAKTQAEADMREKTVARMRRTLADYLRETYPSIS